MVQDKLRDFKGKPYSADHPFRVKRMTSSIFDKFISLRDFYRLSFS